MKKILIVSTILLTGALLVGGIYFPDFPLMWLAGTSLGFEIIRAALIIILGILLFSHPPRALYFRYAIAGIAVILCMVTTALVLTYKINVIDTIVFIEAAIIFGIEALESPSKYPTFPRIHTDALAK